MSNKKTRHQVDGWGCHHIVKNADLELFLSKQTAGTKMEKRLKEGGPMTLIIESHLIEVHKGPITGAMVCLKMRPDMAVP